MPRRALLAVLLIPAVLAGQSAPRLDPVIVPPALEQLGFRLEREPPIGVHSSG